MSTGRFTDKVAVVTGGTSGIGLATVQRLHGGGASVVFCGRRASAGDDVVAALDASRAVFVVADVTLRPDVERLYATAVERFGRLDVVVNNAGTLVVGPTLDVKPA